MAEQTTSTNLEDDENGIDGCDVEVEKATLDEELPVAEGGVA